ncbi:unnamed protein product [Symbiodinium natans]|uniref:Uncharacterized protein n=1 Tax=Symbiodinium natans TaxID=878477 RepID=A0A812HEC1_9DINO|nr:unnamed protein product [Symbiodinium natans]
MGVPGGRAECLTPSGRRQWQPLDSPLWQATPRSMHYAGDSMNHQASWHPDILSLAELPHSSRFPLLGSDAWLSRPTTARTTSSRPRTAGSAAAALEAAKAAGEAAKAAADAAMVAARLICQGEEPICPVAEVEILELPSGNSRPSSPREEDVSKGEGLAFCNSMEVWKMATEEEQKEGEGMRLAWAKLQQSFIRSLARPSEDMSALDDLMASSVTRPPVGVFPNVTGRWNLPPDNLSVPRTQIPEFPSTSCREDPAAPDSEPSGLCHNSVEDFMAGLSKARDAFEVIVSLSPGPQKHGEQPKSAPLPITEVEGDSEIGSLYIPLEAMAGNAAMKKTPLYKDKFVEIYSDHMQIKSYYFPLGREKRVDIPSQPSHSGAVSFATDRDLDFTWLDWKAWGMAPNNVWWASDRRRGSVGRHRNLGIVVTVGKERIRKGFSVEDDQAALKVLDGLLPRTAQNNPA